MKPIRTTCHYMGNKYGRISKHSAKERLYSVELDDGSLILEDHFYTLRGAKLAVELMEKYGVRKEAFYLGDWDATASIFEVQRKIGNCGYTSRIIEEAKQA